MKLYPYLLLCCFLSSCNQERSQIQSERDYVSIQGRDTSELHLVLFKDRFYGKLVHRKPGGYLVEGELNGKIVGDTLIGDHLYQPYKWANKKLAPIAFLHQDGNYLEGTGLIQILLAVPHFAEGSLSFEVPARIYKPL